MEKQIDLFKGEAMEEKLRSYFLNSGYYVARGVKYKFQDNEITDVDLYLYGRVSSLSRERINVDIKNKKSPKAFERILWAKGLQEVLKFDKCVVATSERKEVIRHYGLAHNTIILDGNFLRKLPDVSEERITEESLLIDLGQIKSYKEYKNKSWAIIHETSKSRVLNELDFSGFNSSSLTLRYFIKKCFDKQKKVLSMRMTYLHLSYCLLILDFILKDVAFNEPDLRRETLSDGFKYGNLGIDGINRTIEMAVQIAQSKTTFQEIKKSLETTETDILSEYFSKIEVSKKMFKWAVFFEALAFQKNLLNPVDLDPDLKSALAVMLDYSGVKRKDFFAL